MPRKAARVNRSLSCCHPGERKNRPRANPLAGCLCPPHGPVPVLPRHPRNRRSCNRQAQGSAEPWGRTFSAGPACTLRWLANTFLWPPALHPDWSALPERPGRYRGTARNREWLLAASPADETSPLLSGVPEEIEWPRFGRGALLHPTQGRRPPPTRLNRMCGIPSKNVRRGRPQRGDTSVQLKGFYHAWWYRTTRLKRSNSLDRQAFWPRKAVEFCAPETTPRAGLRTQ